MGRSQRGPWYPCMSGCLWNMGRDITASPTLYLGPFGNGNESGVCKSESNLIFSHLSDTHLFGFYAGLNMKVGHGR